MRASSPGRAARLGLGLAALGRPAYINLGHHRDLDGASTVEGLERRCHDVLDAARGAGVTYFDAARSYGRAEVFLKRWLDARAIEPGEVTVASKWGYAYVADWDPNATVHETKDHSAEHLEAQWALTRATLWEYLDVYQIHSATSATGVLRDREVLRRLGDLRDDRGLRIGLSLSGPGQVATLKEALEVEHAGRPLFEVVQVTANLLERSALPALELAGAEGRTVVVKEALANGRLAGRDDSGRSPALQARLREIAEAHGLTPDAAAIGALLFCPGVEVVLSGASSVEQLASNLRAVELPAEAADALWRDTEGEAPDSYWAHRKTLSWT